MSKHLVVVYPPPAVTRDALHQAGAGSVTVGTPTRVVEVQARFPEDAAEKADVAPGGYCVVVTGARRFDRATKAPLAEKALDGNPIAEPADAA